MILHLLLLSLLSFTTLVSGERELSPPDVQWTKGYAFGETESHPHAGVQTRDGGFLLVGDGMNYSASANTLKRQIDVMKTDKDGNMQWQTSIGSVGYNYGKFARQLRDGNIVVAGALSEKDPKSGQLALKRSVFYLNVTDGTEICRYTLGNSGATQGLRDGFMSFVESKHVDGRLILTGFVGGENATSGYPDEPMFLILGGKTSFTVLDIHSDCKKNANEKNSNVLVDTVVDDEDLDFFAMQGMRIVFDEVRELYIVSHTTTDKDPATYGNIQFGMSCFSVNETSESEETSVTRRWTKQFPATPKNDEASLGGHASHPYALTLGVNASAYVLGGLAVIFDRAGIEQCQGRVLAVDPTSSEVQWDRRFTSAEKDTNIECYGLDTMPDGGYVLSCGTGVEPELHPSDSDRSKTWRVLVHRTDTDGTKLWETTYTSNAKLQNNAGEYVVVTRTGELAVYVDSQSFGPSDTGGNFALMLIDADTRVS